MRLVGFKPMSRRQNVTEISAIHRSILQSVLLANSLFNYTVLKNSQKKKNSHKKNNKKKKQKKTTKTKFHEYLPRNSEEVKIHVFGSCKKKKTRKKRKKESLDYIGIVIVPYKLEYNDQWIYVLYFLVTGHFVPKSFRTQVISYPSYFVPVWSFRTHFYFQFGHFVPSLVISYPFRTQFGHFVPTSIIF